MSNQVARSFLNDESKIKLENSVGVRDGIAVKKRIDKLEMRIIECRMKLKLLPQLITQKDQELSELNQKSLLNKLFQGKKIKSRIEELQAKIKEFKEDIKSTRERLCELEREQDRRRRELSQFETVIGRVGLMLEDIEKEYILILHELYLKEQGVELKVVPGQGKTQRPSQTEKFNTRLAKREAMLAGKEPKPEQEAQSE